ncbi:MAG TPA: J domain-containing protein [Candidatus Didemnitutus sp.]|nr:J domain-containing protein [Candidatus Didemnitutus sp.]
MAVQFKDYYAVLGVPRDATPEAIKTAFRKLARQYHPDVAKDKASAEAKFKEINEAHEVLSDPEKRQKYDTLGANWQQAGAGAEASSGWNPGGGSGEFHFGGTGFSDFFEQFFSRRGASSQGDYFRRSRGSPFGDTDEPEFAERGEDIEGDILVTLDEALHGSMRTLNLRRTDPRTGESETESFRVRIPPGAQQARRIRVPGKGQPGQGGAPAGDLYLRVRIAAHPDFEVNGADLHYELLLAPWEAVLGAQAMVPTLEGTIKLRVPPGTVSGKELRVRGRGLPQGKSGERGDLYVVVRVQVPAEVSAKEKALWEELARTSTFRPRRE